MLRSALFLQLSRGHMNDAFNRGTVIFYATLAALFLGAIAWLAPFSPIGRSPFAPSLTPTPLFAGCQPVLLTEDFGNSNGGSANADFPAKWTIRNGRLRFVISSPETGLSYPLDGQYEQYILSFSAYPVGDVFDASINILIMENPGGFFELRVRPRSKQYMAFKSIRKPGEAESNLVFSDWTEHKSVALGAEETRIQLEVKRGFYALYVNGEPVVHYVDQDPYLRGTIDLGVGAGKNAPISIEIDNVRICGLE